MEEAAANLGANRWQVARSVLLPLALPAVGAAAALTFLFTFSSFGVMLILGGARFATLEVEIYRQATQMLRLDVAASLAVIQMAVTLLTGWASARLEAGVPLEAQSIGQPRRRPSTPAERALVWGSLAFVILVLLTPMATLVMRSFDWEGGPPWRYYAALGQNVRGALFFVPPQVAIGNSLLFAFATMLLTMLLGVRWYMRWRA